MDREVPCGRGGPSGEEWSANESERKGQKKKDPAPSQEKKPKQKIAEDPFRARRRRRPRGRGQECPSAAAGAARHIEFGGNEGVMAGLVDLRGSRGLGGTSRRR